MKQCGYFYVPDPWYDDEDGEAVVCHKEATHISSNYRDVCEDHTSICSKPIGENKMKKELERKVNRYYDLEHQDEPAHLAHDGVLRETLEFEPKEFDITLEGIEGLRLTNDGSSPYGTIIEVKHGDGEWVTLGGVQKIEISMDTECPVPVVRIERYLYGQGIKANEESKG